MHVLLNEIEISKLSFGVSKYHKQLASITFSALISNWCTQR